MKNIIIKPILTEKMAEQSDKLNRYAFVVNRKANKIEIRNAFEEYYDVSVVSVNTLIHGGGKSKMKHTSKGIVHQKKKILKKAIITLAEGDVIDLYENI